MKQRLLLFITMLFFLSFQTTGQSSRISLETKRLLKEYKKFQNEMNDYSKKFIKENPDADLSVLLLENFLM